MVRILLICLLLSTSCAPGTPSLQLETNCLAEYRTEELVASHWLLQPETWRIRQSALLEIGHNKIPMEGFLRLDLQRSEARLLAMNDLGVVLFDLQVTPIDEHLHRILPQLQQIKGLAEGVAQSLRQIFLQPQPQLADRLEQRGNSQRLWRALPGGTVGFLFDCDGDLRETSFSEGHEEWRVIYGGYQLFESARIPGEIVMNDYQHKVKLSLWLREVKEEI